LIPVWAFLLHCGAKQLVMVLETLLIAGRLQDRLEKIQKHRRVLGLLGQGVQIRALPFGRIQRVGGAGPFLIEVHTFPAITDGGPNLPSGVGSEYDDGYTPTVAARFIAIQLDKAIISLGQRSAAGNLHGPGLACCQFRESLHKRCHGHGGMVARSRGADPGRRKKDVEKGG
jgi:hypothetical protein